MTIKIVTLKNLYGGIVNLDKRMETVRNIIRRVLYCNNPTNSVIDWASYFFLGEENKLYLLANLDNQPRLCRVTTSHKDWLTPEDVNQVPADYGKALYFYQGGDGCLLDKSRHVIIGLLLDNQTEPYWFTEAKLMHMFTP